MIGFVLFAALVFIASPATALSLYDPMLDCSTNFSQAFKPMLGFTLSMSSIVVSPDVPIDLNVTTTVVGDNVSLSYGDVDQYELSLSVLATAEVIHWAPQIKAITYTTSKKVAPGFTETKTFHLRQIFPISAGFYEVQVLRHVEPSVNACSTPLLFRQLP